MHAFFSESLENFATLCYDLRLIILCTVLQENERMFHGVSLRYEGKWTKYMEGKWKTRELTDLKSGAEVGMSKNRFHRSFFCGTVSLANQTF